MGFDRDSVESIDRFGSIDILTVLRLCIHEHEMSVYLGNFQFFPAMFYNFKYAFFTLVKCIPGYFILLDLLYLRF